MFSNLMSRRLVAVALVGVTAAGLVACGDDAKTAATDTTTTAPASGGSDTSTTADTGSSPAESVPGESTQPDSTQPKVPFDEGVAKLQDSIDAAKGDTCELFKVYSGEFNVEDPTTPDQVRQAIDLTVSLFSAIADAAPADQAAAKDKISSGVTTMRSAMEAANYSVDSFNNGDYFNQDLQDGLKAFTEAGGTNCK